MRQRNISDKLENLLDVIAQFAKEKEQLCQWLKMKILKLLKERKLKTLSISFKNSETLFLLLICGIYTHHQSKN